MDDSFLLECKVNDLFTDVVLKCKDGNIRAHRIVLSRSLYFHTMFTSPFVEAHTKQVLFNKVSVKVMDVIVDFLYRKMPIQTDGESLVQILKNAHMMHLEKLVEYCWNNLTILTTDKNFLNIWDLAETYDRMDILANMAQNITSGNILLNMLTVSDHQMRNIVSSMNSKDDTLAFICDWVKVNYEERLSMLETFELDDASFLFIRNIVKTDRSIHETIRNILTSHLAKRLSESIFITVYSDSRSTIQKYCLKEKIWFPQQQHLLKSPHIDAWPLHLANGDLFWTFRGSIYNPRTCEWFYKIYNKHTIMASHDNHLYVLNETFARFDMKRNVCETLAPLTQQTPLDDSSLYCGDMPYSDILYNMCYLSRKHISLVVIRDKLFYIYCGRFNLEIYTYSVTSNEWHFQAGRYVQFVPIKSNCFRPNCNEYKLYFQSSKDTKDWPIHIYDVESNTWTEIRIETLNLNIVCVNCDKQIILFKDMVSTQFCIYHLDTGEFEYLPITKVQNDDAYLCYNDQLCWNCLNCVCTCKEAERFDETYLS